MTRTLPRTSLLLGLAGLLALPVIAASAGTAHADQVRVRAGGQVRAGGTVRVRGPARARARGPVRAVRSPHVRVRVHAPGPRVYAPRVRVRTSPYVGGHVRVRWGAGVYLRFAEPPPPPPPPCAYGCAAVGTYYPAPPPPPATVVAAPPPPPRPDPLRVGLGAFVGGVHVDGEHAGSDIGLLGRFRLRHGFELEAEIAKTEHEESARVDRRLGGALLYDFSPYGRLSPYILGGAGFGQADSRGGQITARQAYGEIGVGLTYRIGPRFHLVGDLRAGARKTEDDGGVALRTFEPVPIQDDERYTRARLGALIYF